MLFTIFSVFYVLIAAAMIVLILLQRGDGANAGASFGGGASGTVFGARGSASFMTRATGVLAGLFFILSLAMGIYLSRTGVQQPKQNLGVMAGAASASSTAAPASAKAVAPAQAPASSAPASTKPAPVQNTEVPQATPAKSSTPAASKPAPASSGGKH